MFQDRELQNHSKYCQFLICSTYRDNLKLPDNLHMLFCKPKLFGLVDANIFDLAPHYM